MHHQRHTVNTHQTAPINGAIFTSPFSPSRPRAEWPLFIIPSSLCWVEDSSCQCRCRNALFLKLCLLALVLFSFLQVSLRQIFPLSLFFAGVNSHGSLPFRFLAATAAHFARCTVCSFYPFTVLFFADEARALSLWSFALCVYAFTFSSF